MQNKRTSNIYKKLFHTYTIVITVIVLVLEIYFITSIRSQQKETNFKYTQIMSENAVDSMNNLYTDIENNLYQLYDTDTQMQDMIWFLENPMEDYLKKKLDAFYESTSTKYYDFEDFVQRAMEKNESIKKVSLIGYNHENRTDYFKTGEARTYEFDMQHLDVKEFYEIEKEGSLTLTKEIRNPNDLQSIGCIIIEYDLKGLETANRYDTNSELIAIGTNGTIIYSSKPVIISNFYDEEKIIHSKEKMENKLDAFVDIRKVGNITIVGYINKQKAQEIPLIVWLTLVVVGICLFAIGELFAHLKLKRLETRMESILNAMDKITQGDLTTQLSIGRETDELDIIAQNFNQMSTDLNKYIQKSYIAEIEQKNAEMNALQNQINPHFLYNTLESIRMKAISNGDKEVGKMLYGLAVIFRSQVKENNIIPLAKELHYCKKYLELFEFRYQEKFHFELNCSEEWMEVQVIKFIVQPFIENYFVHGIRLEDDDNFLNIYVDVENQDDTMHIIIEDNGRGMEDEEIIKQNERLKDQGNQSNQSNQSIGIINVQRRIKALYGEEYGVIIEKNKDRGIKTILKFPVEYTKV